MATPVHLARAPSRNLSNRTSPSIIHAGKKVSPWILAARPKTLFAGVCPVGIGVSLAYLDQKEIDWLLAIATLLGAVAIQIGTNFCNDYFDFFQGADTAERKGPTRAVQAGLISPNAMLIATILTFSTAILISVYLAKAAGWVFLLIGVLGVIFGVMYTAGRYSLAYLGLGDIFVLIFFGPVAVAGTYFIQTMKLNRLSVIAGLAPGLIAVGLLVINNLRDVTEDAKAGKKTLAVRFGTNFARLEYLFCIAGAACIPVFFVLSGVLPMSALAVILSLVPGFIVARKIWSVDGAELNPMLGRTAVMLLGYTVLFCLGCILAW